MPKTLNEIHLQAVRLEALTEGLIELVGIMGAENALYGLIDTVNEKAEQLANTIEELI